MSSLLLDLRDPWFRDSSNGRLGEGTDSTPPRTRPHDEAPPGLDAGSPPLVDRDRIVAYTRGDVLWVPDTPELLGLPLALSQKRPRVRGTPNSEIVRLDLIGLSLHQSAPVRRGRPTLSTVLDVYVGLVILYELAGSPPAGAFRFCRHHFLGLIGWHRFPGRRDGRLLKSSGEDYLALDAALRYLAQTRFDLCDKIETEARDSDGVSNEADTLQILAGVTSPRGESDLSSEASVVLSPRFAQMLRRGEGTVRFGLRTYLALTAGSPRQLYRVLAWMRYTRRRRISFRELFQRVGSVQAGTFVPSRVKQLLGASHEELRRLGVLARDPEFEREGGEWYVRYTLGDPLIRLSEDELLVRQAVLYGVSESTARKYAREHPDRLERILAAATLGVRRPRKTLGQMIGHYVTVGHPIQDTNERFEPTNETQTRVQPMTLGARYLAWVANARERMREERDRQVEERLRRHFEQRPGRAPWVVEGMVQMAMNVAREIGSLDWYVRTRRAAEDERQLGQ